MFDLGLLDGGGYFRRLSSIGYRRKADQIYGSVYYENQPAMRGPSARTASMTMLMMTPAYALLQSRAVSTSENRATPTRAGCHQPHPASSATAATTNPMAATAHNAPKARMPPSPRSQRPLSRVVL